MRAVKIGVIGLGAISCGSHLPGILGCQDAVLSAVCDIDADVLKRVGDQYQIDDTHRFTDYRQLIASPDVDAIEICTPNDCHFPMAMDAVSAGKPFSLEKPVTLTADQAYQLEQATRASNIKNMVCFSYRFKAATRYLRHLVQTGALGEVFHVNLRYYQSWGMPEADCPLVWRFIKKRTGSGALGDLGSHALDLVRFVTRQEYRSVAAHLGNRVPLRKLEDGSGTGQSDVDDYCDCLAQLDGGASASIQVTRLAYGRVNYQQMEIYGSKASAVYTLDEIPNLDELQICTGHPILSARDFVKADIPSSFQANQTQAFLDILNGCEDGLSATISDGRINQQIMDAVLEAGEKQTWIPLVGNDIQEVCL